MSDTKENTPKQLKRLIVTCFSNDPDIGYKRTLATFVDGNDVLDREPAQSKAMYWLEDLLDATNNFSLFDTLRKIHAQTNLSIVDMPLIIVNLVLKEYGLEIEED